MCSTSPIDCLDALKHISTTNRQLHEARIRREFRLVITVLTFFAACVSAKFAGSIPTDGFLFNRLFSIFDILIWFAFSFIAYLAWRYLKSSADANAANQARAEVAEDVMQRCLEETGSIDIPKYQKEIEDKRKSEGTVQTHPCRDRWKWQAWIVTLGAVISAILISFT